MDPPYREFKTVAEYEKVFQDVEHWRSYIDAALQQAGLPSANSIEHPRQGSNIVFLIDDEYFVKIFTPVLNGKKQQGIERFALETLDRYPELRVPKLLASGDLFPDREWPWDFVITRKLEGKTLEEQWPSLDQAQKKRVAKDVGEYLRLLHQVEPPLELRELLARRMGKGSFLTDWIRDVHSRCERFGLPPHLSRQAPEFIKCWMPMDPPDTLLNGDLTGEHIYGAIDDREWRTTGFIDYGDLKLGPALYDFVAPHFGAFDSDKLLLQEMLSAYGVQGYEPCALMALSLVHEWDVLREPFQQRTDLAHAKTLDEVADLLWRV